MAYRIEISPNNRAGCQATGCKKHENGPVKIMKGEIRQGVSVTINEHTSMKYRHWGCVTPAVLHNWHETSGGDMDLIDGYDELPADAQKKVKRALDQGHVDDEDWNGDVECNRWNGKKSQGMFLKGNAKKQAGEAADGDAHGDAKEDAEENAEDDENSNNNKRSAEAESDEDEEPAAKKARTTEPKSASEATPAKRGRGRPKKDSAPPTPAAAKDGDAAPKRGRGRPRKSVATDGAADEEPAADTPKRGRGRPKKVDGTKKSDVPKKDDGPKRGRGRPRKSVPAEGADDDNAIEAAGSNKGRGRPKNATVETEAEDEE